MLERDALLHAGRTYITMIKLFYKTENDEDTLEIANQILHEINQEKTER